VIKNLINKLTEGILMLSSTVTTLTVLLIIVFLFSEGLSVFKESPLEGENIIVLNHHNSVSHISSSEIKDIFDQKITNWKTIGGSNDSIILFTFNDISNYFSEEELGPEFEYLPAKMDSLLEAESGMIAVFSSKYFFKNLNQKLFKRITLRPTLF